MLKSSAQVGMYMQAREEEPFEVNDRIAKIGGKLIRHRWGGPPSVFYGHSPGGIRPSLTSSSCRGSTVHDARKSRHRRHSSARHRIL